MTILPRGTWAIAAGAATGLALAASAVAQHKEIVIGDQCDRTGATQIVGTVLCPAMQDYYKLINSEGGVDGWTITRRRDRQRVQGARRRSKPTSGRSRWAS